MSASSLRNTPFPPRPFSVSLCFPPPRTATLSSPPHSPHRLTLSSRRASPPLVNYHSSPLRLAAPHFIRLTLNYVKLGKLESMRSGNSMTVWVVDDDEGLIGGVQFRDDWIWWLIGLFCGERVIMSKS
ncbi:hypothetical protein Droror1_Dr00007758 [Drosera rotundifolia]